MENLLEHIKKGDFKSIARGISLIENEMPGYELLLQSIMPGIKNKIIGITGAPGAGKSTLTDALICVMVAAEKKVAVLCIDPSSPFNLGALLGDRIRMSEWYNNPNVFIRSLASRGNMGGLHPKIIEITDLLKASPFDYIIIETVGIGQSEIDIAGVADATVVLMVPEGGDEIQTMKAGLMEIADVFVVNKSDRPGAELFIKNLLQMLAPVYATTASPVPVMQTIAHERKGIIELYEAIKMKLLSEEENEKKLWLLAERVYQLIQKKRMKDVDKNILREKIKEQENSPSFNIYKFVSDF